MTTLGLRHRHPSGKNSSVPDPGIGGRSQSPPPVSIRRIESSTTGNSKASRDGSRRSNKRVRIDPTSSSGGSGTRTGESNLRKYNSKSTFTTTSSRSTSIMSSPTSTTPANISLPHLESQLFNFCKIPLGDFESCLSWLTSHPPPTIDYTLCKEKMLWQTYKTFERLLKRDFEERCMELVKSFAEQCVRTLAILDYTDDCGWEKGKEYVRHLVLTPEIARMNYLSRMMSLPPQERLEFINRPVLGHLHKLKFFCLLYDHLYEKIEQETRHRMEKTLLDKFQTRLETVQTRLSRGLAGAVAAAGGSPVEGGGTEVGRAL